MNKIKVITILIFIVSIFLIIISNSISKNNKINNNILATINKQKAFTQEISKNIFYIYKNKNTSPSQITSEVKYFTKDINNNKDKDSFLSNDITKQNHKIISLWNKFYLKVEAFKNLKKVKTAY